MAFTPKDNISQYLSGELKDDQLMAFQQAMQSDKDLRGAVALQQRIEEELSDREEIEALLRKAEQDHPYVPVRKSTVRSLPRWLFLAAMVVIGIGSWFLLKPRLASPVQLAERYGALNFPESVLANRFYKAGGGGGGDLNNFKRGVDSLFRGGGGGYSHSQQAGEGSRTGDSDKRWISITDSARYLLSTRKYKEALFIYQQITEENLSDSLRFERAVLLLHQKQPTEALIDLDLVNIEYNGGLAWYKALAYLQLLDKDKARAELVLILKLTKSPYRLDAIELLEEF